MLEDDAPGLSAAEAAEIIGVTTQSVYRLVHQGKLPKAVKGKRTGLDRDAVERAGLDRVPTRGGHPHWLTSTEAATVLGVTTERVHQLVRKGFLPAVEHNGRRLFRRPQLEVVANARRARWTEGANALASSHDHRTHVAQRTPRHRRRDPRSTALGTPAPSSTAARPGTSGKASSDGRADRARTGSAGMATTTCARFRATEVRPLTPAKAAQTRLRAMTG